ncbi:MAG: hypothetical protein K0S39_1845 [Paenibacillus sp.]|jgi:hypothetical protein|nr:hypothetical protein [Paenibacillus sp.]
MSLFRLTATLTASAPQPTPEVSDTAVTMVLIFIFVIPALAAAGAIIYGIKKGKKDRALRTEKEILNLAHTKGGILSVAEVAMNTRLSMEEAELVLDSFVKRNFVEIKVADSGAVFYEFPGIKPKERESAKSLYDLLKS